MLEVNPKLSRREVCGTRPLGRRFGARVASCDATLETLVGLVEFEVLDALSTRMQSEEDEGDVEGGLDSREPSCTPAMLLTVLVECVNELLSLECETEGWTSIGNGVDIWSIRVSRAVP